MLKTLVNKIRSSILTSHESNNCKLQLFSQTTGRTKTSECVMNSQKSNMFLFIVDVLPLLICLDGGSSPTRWASNSYKWECITLLIRLINGCPWGYN